MAKALYELQKTLSNVDEYYKNGGIKQLRDDSLWQYHWSHADATLKYPWWMQRKSLLSALLANGISADRAQRSDPRDIAHIIVTDDKGNEVEHRIKFRNTDTLSQIGSGALAYTFGHLRNRIDERLEALYGIGVPSDHDRADILRFWARQRGGPIVDAAMLCWPETALYVLDYLEVDPDSPYAYFNDMLPIEALKDTFPLEPNLGWTQGERPDRENFMTRYLKAMEEDFADDKRLDDGRFWERTYEFMYSIAGLCELMINQAENEGNRIPVPAFRNSSSAIPHLPHTFSESTAIQSRPNTTYSVLDIIAALYYASIYGPTSISSLFSRKLVDTNYSVRPKGEFFHQAAPPEGPIKLTGLRYKSSAVRAGSFIEFVFPSQTIVIGRAESVEWLESVQRLAMNPDDRAKFILVPYDIACDVNGRVSGIHLEIVPENGGYVLYDRGKTGGGSTNGTLIIRHVKGKDSSRDEAIYLKGNKLEDPYRDLGFYVDGREVWLLGEQDFTGVNTGTFVICHQPDIFNNGGEIQESSLDGSRLGYGVRLRQGDIICPAPGTRGGRPSPDPGIECFRIGIPEALNDFWPK